MKKITLVLAFLLAFEVVTAQNNPPVIFNKFKLSWFNVMGMRGGGGSQSLKMTFSVLTNRTVKYIVVEYFPVNKVNDIVKDNFQRNDFNVTITGPLENSDYYYSRYVQIALFYPELVIAYPHKLTITYMDNIEEEIIVDNTNLNIYFPNIEKIEIGNLE